MSQLIHVKELSVDNIRNSKMVTRRKLAELILGASVVTTGKDVVFRDAMANTDLGITNGTDTDEFTTGAMTAGTDYTYVSLTAGVPQNKRIGFYGMTIVGSYLRPPVIGALWLTGNGGANVMGDFDLQSGYGYEERSWFFDNPLIYNALDIITVRLRVAVSTAANALQVVLRALVAEPAGNSVMR